MTDHKAVIERDRAVNISLHRDSVWDVRRARGHSCGEIKKSHENQCSHAWAVPLALSSPPVLSPDAQRTGEPASRLDRITHWSIAGPQYIGQKLHGGADNLVARTRSYTVPRQKKIDAKLIWLMTISSSKVWSRGESCWRALEKREFASRLSPPSPGLGRTQKAKGVALWITCVIRITWSRWTGDHSCAQSPEQPLGSPGRGTLGPPRDGPNVSRPGIPSGCSGD